MNRKKKRSVLIIWILMAACVFVGLSSIFSYIYVQKTGADRLTFLEYSDDMKKVGYVLIPGAGTVDGAPSSITEDHLKRGIQLYALDLTDKLVLSGGRSETAAMQRYLSFYDIPESDIWVDEYGIDTYNSIKRADEYFKDESMYFCTLPRYAGRAGYIIDSMGIDGKVVCSSLMISSRTPKSYLREYFASTKAFLEARVFSINPRKTLNEEPIKSAVDTMKGLSSSQPPDQVKLKDPDYLLNEIKNASEITSSTDTTTEKATVSAYNTAAAIKYARKYSLDRNPDYPEYERNCTNFVSQCLIAGGFPMKGSSIPTDFKYVEYDTDEGSWYCISKFKDNTYPIPPKYKISTSFVRNESFVKYWTETMNKELFIVDNTFTGRQQLRTVAKEGDIFILYDENEDISHIGLITDVSDYDALYCGNTSDRRDFSTSGINDTVYPKFGIILL